MNNYDDIIFEDNDDESCSALTEDVGDGTHGTPFSPVVFEPRKDYGPVRTSYRSNHTHNDNEDAMMLAQSKQQTHLVRATRVGRVEREDSNMGYLPSRHFHQFVVDTQPQRPSLDRNQDSHMSSLSNWTDIQSPSNESQNTLSTIRSNRSMNSVRSRRTMVSHYSSTSLSILHGEVINLEGKAAFQKNLPTTRINIPSSKNCPEWKLEVVANFIPVGDKVKGSRLYHLMGFRQ